MEFSTGALGTLLPKLGKLLQDEYNFQKRAKKNIEFLKGELESIHAALRSAGEVPPDQLSELVRIWARDARELSYDMEDIVDTFLVRVQGPSKRTAKMFIKDMLGFLTKAKIRHEIGQEINDVKERVKEVAERHKSYNLPAITGATTFDVDLDPRVTSLYTKATQLVGIDEAMEELIMRLTKADDMLAQQKIVSIVGFGGLGKTTLAKAVYGKLKGRFNCTAFVPVGRNPELKKVFRGILINLDKQRYMDINFKMLDERQLVEELKDFLINKRYFIVIDDVWDIESWRTIKLGLVENNSKSRIIITTRTHGVAKEADEVYKLRPLSYENSRKLFFARIFGSEIKSSDHQLDNVSDEIIRKCDGIPLAIITMASLLVGKPRKEWSEVNRSISFGNKENQQVENTMKILSFSYYDLPSNLRTCLLYLSVFPEDYYIEKGRLIWMWIAEGFVKEKQGMSPFKIGEGYLNELVNRSIIQLVEESEEAMDTVEHSCHIHDMVLDLIRSISSEENFVTILDNNEGASSSSQGKVRRLALQNNITMKSHMDMKQVRSYISFGLDSDMGVPVSSFKLVRVLVIHIRYMGHVRNLTEASAVSEKENNLGNFRAKISGDQSSPQNRTVEPSPNLQEAIFI